jgi:UDP-GlcNAc:undecaprenyl-phosphate GlcNAc-1-phosphate transferase
MKIYLTLIIIMNFIIFLNYKKISNVYNIYDYPDKLRKIHKNPTPLLGGLIILINLLFYLFARYIEFIDFNFFKNESEILVFLFISVSFFAVGFFDDKYHLKPNLKLFAYIILIISLMLLDSDLIIKDINFTFIDLVFNLKYFNFFFTILCFLLFINSFNMLDGINGQAASYSFFIIILFIFLKINLIFFISLSVPLLFFIYFNFKEKMFLGDSGTILLGFILSYFFIKSYNSGLKIYSDEIFLIMMIPGFELLRLAVLRIIKKKHPFSPDNNHIHHLLIRKTNFVNCYLLIQFLLIFPFIFYIIVSNSILSFIISSILYCLTIFRISK